MSEELDAVLFAAACGAGAMLLRNVFGRGVRRNSDTKREDQERLSKAHVISERELVRLADSPYASVRLNVVRHPRSSVDIVSYLARDKDQQVRAAVAASGRASVEAQQALAADPNTAVLLSLARGRHTDEGVLRALSSYSDRYVRLAVAQNMNSTNDVLRKLQGDRDGEVRSEAKSTMSRKIRSER